MGRGRYRTLPVVAVATIGAAVVLTAGCGAPSDPDPQGYRKTGPAATDTLPAGTCPQARSLGTSIDYADFVQHDGRTYIRDGADTALPPDALGERVGVVRCTFSGNTDNPWLAQREGDAAFLAPGTELRAVAGRPATQAIAVAIGARWVLYRAEGTS